MSGGTCSCCADEANRLRDWKDDTALQVSVPHVDTMLQSHSTGPGFAHGAFVSAIQHAVLARQLAMAVAGRCRSAYPS